VHVCKFPAASSLRVLPARIPSESLDCPDVANYFAWVEQVLRRSGQATASVLSNVVILEMLLTERHDEAHLVRLMLMELLVFAGFASLLYDWCSKNESSADVVFCN
jgi:hypothetical protein